MWQIGSARTDITPPVGIWQAGFGARTSPSTGVHIPLHTTALAIGDGTRKAAICMNDLVGLSRPEIERIRALAAERCDGLDPGDILVCCTHTHSGPAVSTYLRGQPKDLGYIEWLCGAIAHTIVEAVGGMQPATLHRAEGRVEGFNHNRRDESGYCEKRLAWLEARDADGGVIGGIVNFTAHPTMLTGQNLLLSGDYAGVLTQELSRELDAPVGMLNGCHGNINAFPRAHTDLGIVEDHGRRLAAEVLRLRDGLVEVPDGDLDVRTRMVELTFGPPQPRALYEEIAADTEQPGYVNDWARDVLARYQGDPVDGSDQGEVMVIRIGDVAVVGIPGHAFAEVGRDIIAALPGLFVLNANHANDYLGYFGTREAHADGGYEIEFAYRFNSSFRWAMDADTTERIQQACVELARG